MTRWDIRPATSSWWRWLGGSRRAAAPTTPSLVLVAMSSRSSWTGCPRRATPQLSPAVSAMPSPGRWSSRVDRSFRRPRMGIALVRSGTPPEELMRQADQAMYESKSRRKGTYSVYAHDDSVEAESRPAVVATASQATDENAIPAA